MVKQTEFTPGLFSITKYLAAFPPNPAIKPDVLYLEDITVNWSPISRVDLDDIVAKFEGASAVEAHLTLMAADYLHEFGLLIIVYADNKNGSLAMDVRLDPLEPNLCAKYPHRVKVSPGRATFSMTIDQFFERVVDVNMGDQDWPAEIYVQLCRFNQACMEATRQLEEISDYMRKMSMSSLADSILQGTYEIA